MSQRPAVPPRAKARALARTNDAPSLVWSAALWLAAGLSLCGLLLH